MIDSEADQLRKELDKALEAGLTPKAVRFAIACLGAAPFVGGAISGIGSAWSEHEQSRFNSIFSSWLKLQEDEIKEIGLTIMEILGRLDETDENVQKRIASPEYLRLVKKCFREWSAAESEEKRQLIRNLLSNAAASKLCTDDVIAMFIKWIDLYSEPHFAVMRHIYKVPGCTRQDIWDAIHGAEVREDSAEADLFKLLVHDLSTGHVIRQHRETDYYGNFVKQPAKRRGGSSRILTSAFDDEKQYVLTELGKQFIHYTMNEVVPRLGSSSDPDQSTNHEAAASAGA